jgi:hypothetical protein
METPSISDAGKYRGWLPRRPNEAWITFAWSGALTERDAAGIGSRGPLNIMFFRDCNKIRNMHQGEHDP